MKNSQFDGMVIYPFVLFKNSKEETPDWLFRHELEHVYQVQKEGWLCFYTKYLWYQLTVGYKNNPYEIAATKTESISLTKEETLLK